MGWQDRDYVRETPQHGRVWSTQPRTFGSGRSIVTTLIIVNVVVFIIGSFSPSMGNTIFSFGAMQAKAVLSGQVWRLFTAQYLHGGMGHVFINMLVLHFLGRSLERLWTPKRFFVIYTLCGLCGNLFFTLLGASGVIDPLVPAVGASGCVFGLLGIVAVLFPQATVYIYFLFPMKIRTAAFIFGGIALFTILKRGANYGGEACHLAGLVFGVWWAWRGERWWDRRRARISARVRDRGSSAKPKRGSRRKGGFVANVEQRRADAGAIDEILKKVYDKGVHSLTEREKRTLQQATDRQKNHDGESGRMDRL